MGFFQRIAKFLFGTSSFLEFAGGQKSLKDFRNETEFFVQEVNPSFPLEYIPLIKKLVIAFPDLSQATKRALTLGNPGLEWKINADEKSVIAIQTEIDDFFRKRSGIVNYLLRQVITTGALSSEFVPSLNLDSVEEIRLLPVETIRFKKETDENGITRFVPYERGKFGYVKLNEEQYTYEALEREEDSPYAIPPFISAIRWAYSQFKAQENIDKTLNKWGLLGFIIAKFRRPRFLPGTDAKTFENQQKEFLKEAKVSFEKNSQSGFLATYDDTTVDHHTLTDASKTGGFESISRYIEEQISSGADTDLFILGRSYSVTEAYAKIAGKLFLLKLGNFGHPVKQFLTKAITFHLLAKGYRFQSIEASWKKSISLDPLTDAQSRLTEEQADNQYLQRVTGMVKTGLISPDEGARLLGYDTWHDPEKLETPISSGIGFSADSEPGKKKLLMNEEHLHTCGDLDTFVQLGKWTKKEKEVYEAIEEAFASTFFSSYESRVKEALNTISKANFTKEDAINTVWSVLEKELGANFPNETVQKWRETIGKAWDVGQDFDRPDSKSKIPKIQANKDILDFFDKGYKFDIGKQFRKADDVNQIENAIREAVESGSTDEVVKKLQDKLLGPIPEKTPGKPKVGQVIIDPNAHLRLKLNDIVRGQILRARNFARTERFQTIGVNRLEIVAVLDQKTSWICRALNGKTVEVKTCIEYIRDFLSDDPTRENFWKDRQNPTEAQASEKGLISKNSGDEIISGLKNKMPPFHLRCRTTVVADFTVERRKVS